MGNYEVPYVVEPEVHFTDHAGRGKANLLILVAPRTTNHPPLKTAPESRSRTALPISGRPALRCEGAGQLQYSSRCSDRSMGRVTGPYGTATPLSAQDRRLLA